MTAVYVATLPGVGDAARGILAARRQSVRRGHIDPVEYRRVSPKCGIKVRHRIRLTAKAQP